jgi:sugar transferase (PEP-CTERM/EpsH1 system associated)
MVRTRPYHLIRTLVDRGHQVTVATLWSGADEWRAVHRAFPDVESIAGERLHPWRSAWNTIGALATGDPLQARFSWHPGFMRTLRRLVGRVSYDVVHVEHLRGVRYGLEIVRMLDRAGQRAPAVVWDSVDCISDLFREAAVRGPSRLARAVAAFELPRTERYEGTVAHRFQRILVTSDADRTGLLALAGRVDAERAVALAPRLVVVPNGVDLVRFAPCAAPRDAATLVMSGKMSYHANAVAAVRFAEDVLPRIRARRPDVSFFVVGQNPSREVRRLGEHPGVTITGTVADVRPYLQRATIAVAPIQYGVGIQNKVLEALACATPTIASTVAVRNLGARPGRDLLTADQPDDFANTVLALLEAPADRNRLGASGRQFVEAHHAWSAVTRQLEAAYDDAA